MGKTVQKSSMTSWPDHLPLQREQRSGEDQIAIVKV
jgi:hypothetical protein